MAIPFIICSALVFIVFNIALRRFKNRSVKDIQGPESHSWLLGNELEIRHQEEVGGLEFKWCREYGAVWRTSGCFGSEDLTIADPRALQYILHTSSYHFPKRVDANIVSGLIIGRGISTVEGDTHQRHRRVMSPAFGAGQLKSFLPIFQRSAAKMTQKWKDLIQVSGDQTINVLRQLAKTTIDVIGETAFDYQFEAMDEKDNILLKSLNNLFADSTLYPPAWDILFKATWSYIPRPVLKFVKYIPTREYRRFREFITAAKSIAHDLFKDQMDSKVSDERGKDIMSILIRSNLTEDENRRLDDDEVLSQMANFILAGHDTTASSVSWLLLELARHPSDQQRIRDEIAAARARARGAELTSADLDGMEWLNACIKEGLRYHPIIPMLIRVAGRDDVIPLAYPIKTKSGKIISEIPVNKGQSFQISIATYNRLESVWGSDAHKWNPGRFIDAKEKETGLGVYANLLTFSAGIRGCIGWRFAVIEMQSLVVELMENFQFSLPDEGLDIQRVFAGFMIPMVRDKMIEGTQIPLKVALVQ